MTGKALSMSLAAVLLATTAATAAQLTERMQQERMTVIQVDRDRAQFRCAEHRRWTRVSSADAALLAAGDIVSVDRQPGGLVRVRVVRHAADELGSPE